MPPPTPAPAAPSRRVAAVVEQSWHRVPGGTAVSTVRTLGAIARRGAWDVVGLAAAHRGPAAALAPPPVPVHHSRLPRPLLYEAWHRFRRPSTGVSGADVVHATGGAVPPPGPAALVVTIHDLAFLQRPEHFTPRGVRFLTRALELTMAEAVRVIVPSQATAAECRAAGVDADRLRVVPWGAEARAVTAADRARAVERFDLPDRFLLWVGAAEPRKNLDGLVAALRRADRDVPLILAGSGGWDVDVAALLRDAPPGSRHVGAVDTSDLATLYDLATVFVYPSLQEGFGMPVLEAMAQGTPVITSAGTATEEIVGAGGIAVDPTDTDALAGAIVALLDDPDRRSALGRAAALDAAAYTWDATAAATEAVYAEAADDGAAR